MPYRGLNISSAGPRDLTGLTPFYELRANAGTDLSDPSVIAKWQNIYNQLNPAGNPSGGPTMSFGQWMNQQATPEAGFTNVPSSIGGTPEGTEDPYDSMGNPNGFYTGPRDPVTGMPSMSQQDMYNQKYPSLDFAPGKVNPALTNSQVTMPRNPPTVILRRDRLAGLTSQPSSQPNPFSPNAVGTAGPQISAPTAPGGSGGVQPVANPSGGGGFPGVTRPDGTRNIRRSSGPREFGSYHYNKNISRGRY